jgi:tetratricopeptide (TPR) repeat protein
MNTRMRMRFLTGVLVSALLAGCGKEERITTRSAEARDAYAEGLRQFQLFYYPEARQSFDRAIKADSSFALAWARLGELDMHVRNEAAAKRSLEHAVALASDASRYEQLFIRVLLYQSLYDYTSAARTADSLITLYPDVQEPYYLRGILYEYAKDIESALRMYQRSVEVDTGFALGVMQLAYTYSTLGKTDEALAKMQHYVHMAPGAADPHASYGDLLLRVGRYDEALEQYRVSLEMKPDYWYAFGQIGRIYMVQGRLRDARAQFDEAVHVYSSPERITQSLHTIDGEIEYARGNYTRALEQFQAVLESDSSDIEALMASLRPLVRMKRTEDAHLMVERVHRELVRRNLTESQAMMSYHLAQAFVLNEEGKTEEALEHCSRALEFSTSLTRSAVYNMIARIRFGMRQWDAALDAVEEALKVNPNQADVLMTLVRIYHGMGDQTMTATIGNRLLAFWNNADADFHPRKELRTLLGHRM